MTASYRRPLLALALLASMTTLGACRAQPANDTEMAEAEQPAEQMPTREAPPATEAEPTAPTAAFTTSTAAEIDDEAKDGAVFAVPQQRDLRLAPRTMATPSRAQLAPRALDTQRLQNSAVELRTRPVIRPVGATGAQGSTGATPSNSVRALEATPR